MVYFSYDLAFMKVTYIDPAIMSSFKIFTNSVIKYFERFVFIYKVKWPCVGVLLILIYLILFLPIMFNLRDEIWLIQALVNLIPTKLLKENKKLKEGIMNMDF